MALEAIPPARHSAVLGPIGVYELEMELASQDLALAVNGIRGQARACYFLLGGIIKAERVGEDRPKAYVGLKDEIINTFGGPEAVEETPWGASFRHFEKLRLQYPSEQIPED